MNKQNDEKRNLQIVAIWFIPFLGWVFLSLVLPLLTGRIYNIAYRWTKRFDVQEYYSRVEDPSGFWVIYAILILITAGITSFLCAKLLPSARKRN